VTKLTPSYEKLLFKKVVPSVLLCSGVTRVGVTRGGPPARPSDATAPVVVNVCLFSFRSQSRHVLVTQLLFFVLVIVNLSAGDGRVMDDVTDDDDDSRETDWQKTELEREHNWYNVSGLLHGRTYRLRVAAVDRHGDMMKSEYVEIVVGIHPGIVLYVGAGVVRTE